MELLFCIGLNTMNNIFKQSFSKKNYFMFALFIFLFIFIFMTYPIITYANPFSFNFNSNSHSKLNDIRINSANNDLTITLLLNQNTHSQIFALSHPPRLVVDFTHTKLATSLKNLNLNNSPIKNIRIGYPGHDVTRVVFDLKVPAKFKMTSQHDNKTVVIHLNLLNQPSLPAPKISRPTTSSFQSPTPYTTKVPPAHPIVIVIDPGHGGHDPGAIGSHGTKEKNVTLAISKRLAYLINQQPGMRAELTRNGDYYVGLRGRLKLARKGNADFFIALHADSYFNDHASGASVYALSQHGATSEAARWLAKRDNYSELGGVDLSELGDQSVLLRSVLIDLAQTATITDSLHLGSIMLSNLKQVTRLHYSHVEQAPFMVLKSPDIPSILVEMGFISNSNEEERLYNENYQNKVAMALFNSIRTYLKKYPSVGV